MPAATASVRPWARFHREGAPKSRGYPLPCPHVVHRSSDTVDGVGHAGKPYDLGLPREGPMLAGPGRPAEWITPGRRRAEPANMGPSRGPVSRYRTRRPPLGTARGRTSRRPRLGCHNGTMNSREYWPHHWKRQRRKPAAWSIRRITGFAESVALVEGVEPAMTSRVRFRVALRASHLRAGPIITVRRTVAGRPEPEAPALEVPRDIREAVNADRVGALLEGERLGPGRPGHAAGRSVGAGSRVGSGAGCGTVFGTGSCIGTSMIF
jgi:hypothetical protein